MTRRRKLRRWLLPLALVGLPALALAFFWQFQLRRPIGEGPVAIPVPAAPFSKPWTDRQVLLVGLGDSVTAGFGASPGKSYFERIIANPPDEFNDLMGLCLSRVLPNLSATNLAMSGTTSQQHLRAEIPKLVRQPTHVLGLVVFTTGGNDLIHNYGRTPPSDGAMYGASFEQARPWVATFAHRLETMLDAIRAAFPGGCHIFLANIYDPSDGTGSLRWVGLPAWPDGLKLLAAYNEILSTAADRHPDVHLVDIHEPFLGHGLSCAQFWRVHYDRQDPHYWYHVNVEDPNDRGYDALRRLFLNAIATHVARETAQLPHQSTWLD
ncbi:MAG: SGNH/GDSL hydrolase family protein [Verrucomicrobiales bacterium]|nr:SGNH/GDSL hydrolase family protein [Verrucomicrobiales bacterium]